MKLEAYQFNEEDALKKEEQKKSRAEKFGIMQADNVIEAAHMTYNAPRGIRIVEACIKRLQERIGEIQPKKADPSYKESRYGKKSK